MRTERKRSKGSSSKFTASKQQETSPGAEAVFMSSAQPRFSRESPPLVSWSWTGSSLLRQAESRRWGSAKTESCLPPAASARPFYIPPGHGVPVASPLQPHIASHASNHRGSVYWERVHRPGLEDWEGEEGSLFTTESCLPASLEVSGHGYQGFA